MNNVAYQRTSICGFLKKLGTGNDNVDISWVPSTSENIMDQLSKDFEQPQPLYHIIHLTIQACERLSGMPEVHLANFVNMKLHLSVQ